MFALIFQNLPENLRMWELPQITVLQKNSKIVGTHTLRKFFLIFLCRTHVT
ncbi:hypothetical protein LEP1GSC021_1817 [Leptospira noguchii str. 1993005606]|nr:hypothetical protein LEP1GSC021_1817 [Leptospira noguchii str. 1993005606]